MATNLARKDEEVDEEDQETLCCDIPCCECEDRENCKYAINDNDEDEDDDEDDDEDEDLVSKEELNKIVEHYESSLESHREVIESLTDTLQKIFKRLKNSKCVSKNYALISAIERDVQAATKRIETITKSL
jgi:tRNA C32,U32 (ribose-2'-O)-methylase TrmJ